MVHPFFDSLRYPWSRPEAQRWHKVLVDLYDTPTAIKAIYVQCAASPPRLTSPSPPEAMWTEALDNLAKEKRGLRALCDKVLENYGKTDKVRDAIRAVETAVAAVDQWIFSEGDPELDGDLVIDRDLLRKQLGALESDQALKKVLVVRGDAKSGKSHSHHLFEHIAEDNNKARVVYVCEELMWTVDDLIQSLFEALDAGDRIPPRTSSEPAWYTTVCIKLMGAAISKGQALWVAVDDLGPGPDNAPRLDRKIKEFCDQLVVSMALPELRKRFRLMLIDYPEGPPEARFPTKWNLDYVTEDVADANVVQQAHVEEFLRRWAARRDRKVLETEVTRLAAEVIAKAAAPAAGKSRLRVLNEELRAAIPRLLKEAP
jgi:hypothetical protein